MKDGKKRRMGKGNCLKGLGAKLTGLCGDTGQSERRRHWTIRANEQAAWVPSSLPGGKESVHEWSKLGSKMLSIICRTISLDSARRALH